MAQTTQPAWSKIQQYIQPPAELAGEYGEYRSPLLFEDGAQVKNEADWARRRQEILEKWTDLMGQWPALLERPKLEIISTESREEFTQHKVRVQLTETHHAAGYLLVPPGQGPVPAVLVVFYDPETGVGLNPKAPNTNFAYQLTKRGFVTLSIGGLLGHTPPVTGDTLLQPLSFHAYAAANCHTALAQLEQVDGQRIGVVGHSYGGKWSLFAGALHEPFAAVAVSDPGIVFDESRGNVNYWEPWYLGADKQVQRPRGVITPEAPRTGAYKTMIERKLDLHELHALIAPRPFFVSAGSEDPIERWVPLNHLIAVNKLLGYENRVGMHNRPEHGTNPESNEILYKFFEHFLKEAAK